MKKNFPPLQYVNISNGITSLAMCTGITCLILIAHGYRRLPAAVFILVFILDYFDGVAARRLNQYSRFGGEMDSLADTVNFCAIPALVGWLLGMRSGIEVVLLGGYLLAGIWRLAYYNTHGLENEAAGDPTFSGLPTTYAAAYFLVVVCLCQTLKLNVRLIGSLYFAIAAVLMISALPVRKKGLILPVTTLSVVGSVLLYVLQG